MKRLDGIAATGVQDLATTASNGDTVSMKLYYRSAVQAWFMDITWKEFILEGNSVFSSPNLLSQYEAIIPFGVAVITEGSGNPFLINDFSSGRANIYILSPEEVEQVQEFYIEQGEITLTTEPGVQDVVGIDSETGILVNGQLIGL